MGLEDNYLKQALNHVAEPLMVVGARRDCLFANLALRRLLEVDPDSTLQLSQICPGLVNASLDNDHLLAEFVLKGGDVYRARLALTALPEGSVLVRVVAGSSGLSSESGFHAQRLETLGMLASGISHDFNNVLAGILGHITYLKSVLPATGKHVESVKAIEEGARKASLMTHQILSFSRAENVEKVTRLELGELVSKTCHLLKGAISPAYELKVALPEHALFALGVEAKLTQVIVNLVINARDALAAGGGIKIALAWTDDNETLKAVFRGKDLSASSYAVLTVEDNGHGMPSEVLARAFEPYFSTKNERGTGLGLATVDSIVKFFGGAIEIASEVDKGTRVDVFLPLVEIASPAVEAEPKPAGPLLTGSERIMVVDDEYPVRNVLRASLKHLGYQVEVAESGEQALQMLTTGEGRVDLVILDMLMPGLSGAEVFEQIVAQKVQTRVLLMSGYASRDVISSVLARGAKAFMQKPFTIDELASKVRECLAA